MNPVAWHPENAANSQIDRLSELFTRFGGLLTRAHIKAAGIHERTVAEWAAEGRIVRVQRGVYQLAEPTVHSRESILASLQLRCPASVVCLESALAMHGLAPWPVVLTLAVHRNAKLPQLPGVQVRRFGTTPFKLGVEHRMVHDVPIAVYGAAKTVVDLLKWRHELRPGVFERALDAYMNSPDANLMQLRGLAQSCNVLKAMDEALAPREGQSDDELQRSTRH